MSCPPNTTAPADGGRSRPVRPGYTLAELVVSMGSASLLLVGMASTLMVALQAANPDSGGLSQQQAATSAVDQLRRDLQFATSFSERSLTAADFTVPRDLDLDGNDDRVRYEWPAAAGDPLLRSYNGQAAVALIDGVDDFRLAYATSNQSVTNPTFRSSELQWMDQVPPGSKDFAMRTLQGIGAYFPAPSLPAEAVEWTVTRVALQMKSRSTPSGVMKARIHRAGLLNLPGGVVDLVTVSESDLPTSYDWYEIHFPNATGLSPTEGACFTIVFDQLSLAEAAHILYDDSNSLTPATNRLHTIDAGLLWTSHANGDLFMKVWGKYKTGGNTVTVQYNSEVDFQLQLGSDPGSRLRGSVATLNHPLVP